MGIIIEIIKTGFAISLIIGAAHLILWSIKTNIKWLMGKLGSKKIVLWVVSGLEKDYDEEELKSILLRKGYKPRKIKKCFKKAYRIMIKEVQRENVQRTRELRSPEEEIKRSEEKEQES